MTSLLTLENIFELEDCQSVEALKNYWGYQLSKKDPQGSPFYYLAQFEGNVRPIAVGFFEELNGKDSETLKDTLKTPKSDLYKAIYGHYLNRQLENQPALYVLLPKHKRGTVALVKPTDSGLRIKGIYIGGTEDRGIQIKFNLLRDQSPVLKGLFVDTPNIDHLFYKTVESAEELAIELAKVTREIEKTIIAIYKEEKEKGFLHRLHKAFKTELIPFLDLTSNDPKEYGFADLYAETITYGMFTARCFNPQQAFERRYVNQYIPTTNPFLKELFEYLSDELIAREEQYKPLFDHVEDLVGCLASARMGSVMADFSHDKAHHEDIVIHFYETFLDEFDKGRKRDRGVYYTPSPVVTYIVKSLDEILKEKFQKTEGIADEKVLILDPATGTGTFLFEIFKQLKYYYNTKLTKEAGTNTWDEFVNNNILPRIFGFELMMAPYAVAHLRLGIELKDSEYNFTEQKRLGVYLTNTLEDTAKKSDVIIKDFISNESDAATNIKYDEPIMVVLGNPPYFGQSANEGPWIYKLMRGDDPVTGQNTHNYFEINNESLGERNPKWLNNDYVKFIRFAQWRIDKTGYGIVAFITDHSFLDNPTFRGMRESLMHSFDEIFILDLHGNSRKKEKHPDGTKDENVFKIQQGVSITFFIKLNNEHPKTAKVMQKDLWGPKQLTNAEGELIAGKYHWLLDNDIKSTDWTELEPKLPFYFFVPQDIAFEEEYLNCWNVRDIFPTNSVGIATARDSLTIQWTTNEVQNVINDFSQLNCEIARENYQLGKDVRDWKITLAQKDLTDSGLDQNRISEILYRPFDKRFTYFTGKSRGFHCMPRGEVMRQLFKKDNRALITSRMTKGEDFQHVQVTDTLAEVICMSSKTSNNGFVFPLYVYPESEQQNLFSDNEGGRNPNISEGFTQLITNALNLNFIDRGEGDQSNTFGPEDIFNYIFSILHSEGYRSRYAEFLKRDFPRIPVTTDRKLFFKLANLGKRLVQTQLMEITLPEISSFPIDGENLVERADFNNNRIFINNTQYFDNISTEVWDFHVGGYQVCKQWLTGCKRPNTRKGKKLSSDEINHFKKIISTISETIDLMTQIENDIEEHGGWPIQ